MVRLSGRVKDLETVFTTRALDHAGEREMYSAQPMLCDGRAALNKTRIFGPSHWLNTAYQVCACVIYVFDCTDIVSFRRCKRCSAISLRNVLQMFDL